MGRESREVWQQRVRRWQDGGLTAAEYAAEVGVNPRTLVYWKWKLGTGVRESTAQRFVELAPRILEQREPFELVIGELVVRVPVAFDSDALKRLIAAVRA